ncbi:MAG: caspase family protein [Tepidisphaeraceae bacterium]
MARRALLCGINKYKSQPSLRGCVPDVLNMAQLLTEHYGFQDGDIKILQDEGATKGELLRLWDEWLVAGVQPGDELVFHCSSHGSQIRKDTSEPDEEDDDSDEIFCMHDMAWGDKQSYIVDNEFRHRIEALPAGAKLTAITDLCHSGTAMKVALKPPSGNVREVEINYPATLKALGHEGTHRLLSRERPLTEVELGQAVLERYLRPPPEWQPRKSRDLKRPGLRIRTTSGQNWVHLAACADWQTAADAPIDGGFAGAFTHALCRILRKTPSIAPQTLLQRLRRPANSLRSDSPNRRTGCQRADLWRACKLWCVGFRANSRFIRRRSDSQARFRRDRGRNP